MHSHTSIGKWIAFSHCKCIRIICISCFVFVAFEQIFDRQQSCFFLFQCIQRCTFHWRCPLFLQMSISPKHSHQNQQCALLHNSLYYRCDEVANLVLRIFELCKIWATMTNDQVFAGRSLSASNEIVAKVHQIFLTYTNMIFLYNAFPSHSLIPWSCNFGSSFVLVSGSFIYRIVN